MRNSTLGYRHILDLDRAATIRVYPAAVRTDNGPEFTSRAFMAWALKHGIRHILIENELSDGIRCMSFGSMEDAYASEQWPGSEARNRHTHITGLD